jgi:hypothetical protein
MEGLSSAILASWQYWSGHGRLAETRYTRYDPELGWISEPNVLIPDMYGEGAYLRTDSRGFRDDVEVAPTPAAGKVRIVCSGDSFTFGYGVDNAHTWCHLLGELDDRIESINMGQGGYGIDQAFLWFRRDGRPLRPAIHLFAFINGDFDRMMSNRFLGYGKPTLSVRGGLLHVENVPAVGRPVYYPTTQVKDIVRHLKAYELAGALLEGLRAPAPPSNDTPTTDPARAAIHEVALRVFAELLEMAEADRYRSVLVYLPIDDDCRGRPGTTTLGDWWTPLKPEASKLGVEVVDLTEDCRRLTAEEVDALFFRPGQLQYFAAGGHYTAAGNRFIAKALYAKLQHTLAAGR